MMRRLLTRRLFVLAALAATAAAAGHWPRPAGDAPLRLPAEVRGSVGRLVVVTAEAPAALVRWHACDGPDRPDLWHPPDGKTLLFCTPTPGRYQLWAWTAVNGEPTEPVGCTVLIETPPPPPAPPDPFEAALRAAWDAEANPDKAKQRDRLASLYRVAAEDTVRQPQLQTVGDLFAALQQAAHSLLPPDALPQVRAAIAAELQATLPTAASAPLDAATRDRCGEQFGRVANLLAALP